jgi:ubiquinone/menaquinone biosynthesis C-methylase UbiE
MLTRCLYSRVQKNARHSALDNIQFDQADTAYLPIADNAIDVVISNGAINLSVNKSGCSRSCIAF